MAQLRAADVHRPPREGRGGPVLHLLVRQLAANPAVRPRVGRAIPKRRAGGDRRALTGVPLRARRREGRACLEAMGVTYPIAIDNDFAVWRAFGNQYWPALYVADAEGRLRDHHFGEGRYERSEGVIQQLLAEAGSDGGDPG